jgi:hypothetical protein
MNSEFWVIKVYDVKGFECRFNFFTLRARQPIGNPVPHLAWVCLGNSSGHVALDCDDQEQAERY